MGKWVKDISDEELAKYETEEDVIADVMPGNYIPTPAQSKEIKAAIIERLDRYRELTQHRTEQLNMRLTRHEKQKIQQKAFGQGFASISDYCRWKALEG